MSDHGSAVPRKHLAVLTCGHPEVPQQQSMHSLGFDAGDFHTIAFDCDSLATDLQKDQASQLRQGLVTGTPSSLSGGALDSVWRSLALSQLALGTREVMIVLGTNCAGGRADLLAQRLFSDIKKSPYLHGETALSSVRAHRVGPTSISPLRLDVFRAEPIPLGSLHPPVDEFMLTCMDARIGDGNHRNGGGIADEAAVAAALRALRDGGLLKIRPHTGCGLGPPHTASEYNQLISAPLGMADRNWGTFADPVQAAIESKAIFLKAFSDAKVPVEVQTGIYLVDQATSVWLPDGLESVDDAHRHLSGLGH